MRYIPTYNTNIDEQIARNREIIMRLPASVIPGSDDMTPDYYTIENDYCDDYELV